MAPKGQHRQLLSRVFCLAFLVTFLSQRSFGSSLSRKTQLDSPIRDTQWVGPSDNIVVTLTEQGHVWVSKDGGLTWKDQSEAGLLPGGLDSVPAHGVYEPPKGVQALYFHPDNPKKIFFRGGSSTHWLSKDYGDTFEKIEGPEGHLGVATIRLHPTEPEWILAMARRWSCWEREAASRTQCADDLFLTQDFGKTWRNLTKESDGRIIGFVDFDWGWSKSVDAPKHPGSYTKDTILAAVFENKAEVREHLERNGVGVVAGWDKYVDFVRTTDYFHSAHEEVVECGNQFEIMADKLFLAVADQCGKGNSDQTGVKLKVSTDYGGSFVDACFPELFTERGYSVVYANEHTAFMNVDYNSGPRISSSGDLLSSDETISLFSVVMHRNARSLTGVVDFAAVQGIPGVYIANQITEPEGEPQVHHVGTEDEESAQEYAKSTTMISFNGGASWQPLNAPEYDSTRRRIDCSKNFGCSLHLHGTTSWIGGGGFAFVYSHPSTPGLVISTGNVGSYLYQDSTVNTYLSRDAGRAWEEIAKGAHIYEFGDSGGVIIMTKHGLHTSTDTLLYSLDEGITWEEEKFSDQAIDIYNIRVEPDNQGKKFVIQGLSVDSGDGRPRVGVLITMDFETLSKYKECSSDDYEMWEPSAEGCLLGQNMHLERQRRSSQCWNGEKYKRPDPKITPCTCSVSDYQCDFGTEAADSSPLFGPEHAGKCYAVDGFSPDKQCNRETLSKAGYEQSNDGRRKVAGDKCTGSRPEFAGGNPAHSISQSGGSSSSSSSGSWFGRSTPSTSSSPRTTIYPSSHTDSGAYHSSGAQSSYTPSHSGGSSVWSWLWSIFVFAFIVCLALGGLAYAAYKGLVPDPVLRYFPFLENMRYQSMRSNFQSLAQDFGMSGGDDDYEEMYRRP